MQPSAPKRPVMDISAARRPVSTAPLAAAPVAAAVGSTPTTPTATVPVSVEPPKTEPVSTALPVREAPKNDDDQPADTAQNDHQHNDTTKTVDTTPVAQAISASPQKPPHDGAPIPVGAIIGTIFVMILLSAVAIMIYLKSQ
ncbi:MAG: hypothetical protein ABWX94_03115 [Candidatus Saccharimonadales bacterium]